MFTNYRFVNSTAIRFVAYDIPTATLRIIFQSGAGYDYINVPPHEYQGLVSSTSVGVYFGKHIRNWYYHNPVNDKEVAAFALSLAQHIQADALLRQ